MGEVIDFREKHKEMLTTLKTTAGKKIAVIGLERMGLKALGKFAGVAFTPAKWALDYYTEGKAPSNVDIGLFGVGAVFEVAEAPALAIEFAKAAVNDDIDNKLEAIRRGEEPKYRKFIKACYHYGTSPPLINAQTIAANGGTAWRSKNGLWVYIVDIHGYLVANFQPHNATEIFQPVLPLQPKGNGFKWARKR